MTKGEKAEQEKNEIRDDSEEDVIDDEKHGPEPGDANNKGNEYSELKEQMLRIAAEFDNYKKRIGKELANSEMAGKTKLVKELLPIIDEFELAMLAINNSKDHIAKGMEMLYSNFIDVLKKEGLSEIKIDGIFNPYKHEIIMVKESEKKDGTILEVVKKGYMFGDRLLRPASVIISKETEKKQQKT